jgi:succinoglycan biosynthesis transport protein ExoP
LEETTTMWTTPTAEQPPTTGPKPAGGFNIRIVFHAIRRHPIALCGVVVLALAAAASVWLFLPLPKKTAAVVYHIGPPLFRDSNSQASHEAYRQQQLSLIKLRRTLNAVLDDPKFRELTMVQQLPPDEVFPWLDRTVAVDTRGGPDSIRITVEGDSDKELLALVAAVARAYEVATTERENGARRAKLEELRRRETEKRKELEAFHKQIEDIGRVLNGKDEARLTFLANEREKDLKKAAEVYDALKVRLDRAEKEFAAASHRARRVAVMAVAGAAWAGTLPLDTVVIPAGEVEKDLAVDQTLQRLELEVKKADADLELLDTTRKPLPPLVVTALEARETAKQKRDKRRAEVRAASEARIEAELRARQDQFEAARLAVVRANRDEIKYETDLASAKLAEILEVMRKHHDFRMELEDINTKIAEKKAVVAELATMIERLSLEEGTPHRVKQADEPFIVTGIEGNRRLKSALMAAAGTFLLGFAGVVFWEYRSRRVTHTDEVSSGLGARLLGTIPPLVGTGRATPGAQSNLIEAIDTTRIMLTHGSPLAADLRVLLVTSAVSGEGKTTLSGNLAISLTRAGFRTLLIDGDTCAPTAHALFGLAGSPGLGELLREEADLADAVRSSPIPGLSVLPAGQWTQATHQMLVGDRWRRLKRDLKSRFDFVVIDTSPLLLVSDTMLLAREADGVVVSVLLGVSQIARVAETVNKLQAVGAVLAGVVVNNVRGAAAQHADAYRSKYYAAPGTPALLPEPVPVDSPPKEG